MATRALIGFIQDGPELISTYNHYDGYPDNLGVALENFYEEPNEALKIASMGYISYVNPANGEIEAKHKEPADRTDLDMDWEDAMYEIAKLADSYGADYIYIYNPENYEWVTVEMNGVGQATTELEMALSSLKSMFGPHLDKLPAAPDQVAESKWKNFIKS